MISTWTLMATSSNQTLLPDANIAVGGSGQGPSLVLTPAAGQTGTATITVTVADSYGGSVTQNFTLSVLPVHLAFTVPPTVTAGVPFNITVAAQDSLNQTDTGYIGTVHFTASNGASADYTFTPADMGQHTFTLTLTQALTLTVTGTDTANAQVTGSTTFTAIPAAADHISMTVPDPISAGAPFALTVTVQDAYGNTVTGYGGTVHFTLAGPALAMADYTFTADDMGSHTFSNLVLSQTGMYMLTGTDTGDAMLSGSIMFTVM